MTNNREIQQTKNIGLTKVIDRFGTEQLLQHLNVNWDMLDDILADIVDKVTVQAKGVLTIDDYPVVLPETDDTARVQRLFDDINVKGNTVVFTEGTYMVSNVTISDKKSFSIICHANSMIKRNPMYTGSMLQITGCSDIYIKKIHIDSDDGFGTPAKVTGTYNADSKTYTVDSTAGYKSSGSFYVYTTAGIQSVTYTGKTATSFTGCTNYGVIGGGGMSSPVTTGSDIRPIYGSPLRLIGVSDVDIQAPTILGNFNHAASDMISIEAIGTTTVVSGYNVFTPTTPTKNVKIYQGTFKNSGEEAIIWRNGCYDIWANNNYFENVWGTGVTNKGNNSRVQYNTFVNCYIGTEVNAEASILEQGNDGSVKGNIFRDCGIPVFMQTTGTPLENAGKFVRTYNVEDNKMYNSTFCAIYGRHGTEAIIRNNKIKGVKLITDPRVPPYGAGNGIYLFNVHKSEVHDNKISDCDNEHLWIDSCRDTNMVGNRTRQGGLFTKTTGTFNANAGTFTVETTSGYADSGSFKVSINGVEQTINYTGITATSFTGCTGGDTTAVPTGSFIRDVATKRHVYINTCTDYEYIDNKTMNGYVTFHSAKSAVIKNTKVVNTDATAAVLVTGDSYENEIIGTNVTYARQYAIKLDGTGRTQKQNTVSNSKILYASAGANGGASAIQIINNVNPIANNNSAFSDLANKPTYCVELMNSVTGGTALDNTAIGNTASVPNKDWNTTTPNNMRSKELKGTMTYSADGTLSSKTFPHGLNPSTPTSLWVVPNSADAGDAGIRYFTADATNIYVYFTKPPIAGTNNVSLKWGAGI